MRHQERGMSMWPFVISLVLLLGFIFLWYDQKGEGDKLRRLSEEQAKEISNEDPADPTKLGLKQLISKREELLSDITKHVGFATKKLPGSDLLFTDADLLKKALDPDADGSPMKALKVASLLATKRDLVKLGKGGAAPAPVDLASISKEFKDKVAEARAAFPGRLPAMPDDVDDAAAMAKYKADLEAYQNQSAVYTAKLTDLTKMAEWPMYSTVLGAPAGYDPDKIGEVVNWNYWEKAPVAEASVEEFLPMPALIVKAMKEALTERVNAQLTDMIGLQKINEEKSKLAEDAKAQLEAEQAAHTGDVAKLQAEAAGQRAVAEAKNVEATTAGQALAKANEDRKVEAAKADQAIRARDNRILEDKERKDLAIARNEQDGTLLGADNNLGVGYISLGTADKVYAGVKFDVSYMGHGGERISKGLVMVTKVMDAHYSQVRILETFAGGRPMGAGDMIANPFFDAKRTLHVFIPGDLTKFPKAIAEARLKALGCVIDAAINDKTDFVVIPGSVVAMPTAAAAAPAEGAPAAGAESDFDKLTRLARAFGATLVTERMLESFLGY